MDMDFISRRYRELFGRPEPFVVPGVAAAPRPTGTSVVHCDICPLDKDVLCYRACVTVAAELDAKETDIKVY